MDLVLNPRVRVRRSPDEFCVQTPDPAAGLRTHFVSREDDDAVFRALESIFGEHDDEHEEFCADDATWTRLSEMGVVVPDGEDHEDLVFACDLPRASEPAPHGAIAHPALAVQRDSTLPPAVAALVPGGALPIADHAPIAWILDPVLGVPAAYHVTDPRHAAQLERLRPGRAVPADMPADIVADFAAAQVVVAPDEWRAYTTAWTARVHEARAHMAERGYAVMRGLLAPAQLPALGRYFRAYVAQGYARRGDKQVALRWGAHNQHLVELIHRGLNRLIAAVVACPTVPAYSYFAHYTEGAVLKRHRDRAQCKYSVSLQLDAPANAPVWPLWLQDTRGEVASALLAPGDGLVYRGCDCWHWRDALPEGRTSTSAFLHYVDADFDGELM